MNCVSTTEGQPELVQFLQTLGKMVKLRGRQIENVSRIDGMINTS
jgi:hypothetical protein